MKLRNLFLATLATGLFAACSTDEVPTPGGGGEEAMVNISMAVTDGSIVSKADEEIQTAAEKQINRLTMFVFKGNDVAGVADRSDVQTNSVLPKDFIGDILVAEGTYDVLIVANAKGAGFAALDSKEAVASHLEKIEDQTIGATNNLVMVSGLLTREFKAIAGEKITYCYIHQTGTDNVTTQTSQDYGAAAYAEGTGGDHVIITRQVARIQLDKLTFNPTGYTDATFKLTNVYLVNTRPNTKLIAATTGSYEAVPTAAPYYYRGNPASFDIIDRLIAPATWTYGTSDVVNFSAIYADYNEAYTGAAMAMNTSVDFTTTSTHFMKYAFENWAVRNAVMDSEDNTVYDDAASSWGNKFYDARLVIEGEFNPGSGQSFPTGKRYYHVIIRNKTNTAIGLHDGIRRNVIYKINATITGIGSTNPDGGKEALVNINSQIVVADWNVVNIVEDEL